MSLRVVLADDHPLVREGIRALLEREGMTVVGAAGDGRAVVDLAREHRPDVVVLDESMPLCGGVDAAREILERDPAAGILFLSMHAEEHRVLAAWRAGARGYVVKTQGINELAQAIRDVAAGGVYMGRSIANLFSAREPDSGKAPLTARERAMLQLLAAGKTGRHIASALGVSVKTARAWRMRLMEKLGVRTVAGLVRYAVRNGIVQPLVLLPIACGLLL